MIRVAARDGQGTAHIQLSPPELGRVEIHLRYHAGGVSATLTAQSPDAAQTLIQAGNDLRRSLEAQGLLVHSFDVRQSGTEGRRDERPDLGPGSRSARSGDLTVDASDELDAADPAAAPRLGSQVDVLA